MPSKLLLRVLKVANRLHVGLYRLSGGKVANRAAGMPLTADYDLRDENRENRTPTR